MAALAPDASSRPLCRAMLVPGHQIGGAAVLLAGSASRPVTDAVAASRAGDGSLASDGGAAVRSTQTISDRGSMDSTNQPVCNSAGSWAADGPDHGSAKVA